LWARSRVDDLMSQDWLGVQQGNAKPEIKETITQLGLEYRLMTQFTSFVAVEEMIVTDGGQPRKVEVPVEVPEGTTVVDPAEPSVNSGMGSMGLIATRKVASLPMTVSTPSTKPSATPVRPAMARRGSGSGGGIGAGSGGGSGSGRGGNVGGGSVAPANAPPSVTVSAGAASLVMTESVDVRALTPEETKQAVLRSKLHPTVMAVLTRLGKKETSPGPDESKFIRDGKAELQIWLTDKSPQTLEQLKTLGLEVIFDSKTSKLVIGRLPIEKLEALAQLNFVRYVSPQF